MWVSSCYKGALDAGIDFPVSVNSFMFIPSAGQLLKWRDCLAGRMAMNRPC